MTPPETLETLVTPPETLEMLVTEDEPDAADPETRGVVDGSPDPIVVVDELLTEKYDAGGNHVVESGSSVGSRGP